MSQRCPGGKPSSLLLHSLWPSRTCCRRVWTWTASSSTRASGRWTRPLSKASPTFWSPCAETARSLASSPIERTSWSGSKPSSRSQTRVVRHTSRVGRWHDEYPSRLLAERLHRFYGGLIDRSETFLCGGTGHRMPRPRPLGGRPGARRSVRGSRHGPRRIRRRRAPHRHARHHRRQSAILWCLRFCGGGLHADVRLPRPRRHRGVVRRGRAPLLRDQCAGPGHEDTQAGERHVVPVQRLSLIHISEPTRLGMISYAVFCLKKK